MTGALPRLLDPPDVTSTGAMMRWLETLPHTWIYFIQEGDDGPVKIGRTTSPRARLASLRHANPRDLRMVALWWAPVTFEAALHHEFAEHRLRGEWFAPADDLLQLADSLVWHDAGRMAEVLA